MDAPLNTRDEAEKFISALRILLNQFHDHVGDIGDQYFDASVVLPEVFALRLGAVVYKLRRIRIDAGILSSLSRDLQFPAYLIAEFIAAVESRDFESIKKASHRLDDELVVFERALRKRSSWTALKLCKEWQRILKLSERTWSRQINIWIALGVAHREEPKQKEKTGKGKVRFEIAFLKTHPELSEPAGGW